MQNDHLAELERALAQALTMVRDLAAQNALPPVLAPLNLIAPPRGFFVNVELKPYTDHARAEEWSRDPRWDARNGEVHLTYEPAREERFERGPRDDSDRGPDRGPARHEPPAPPNEEAALRDIIEVVARAESDPSFKFLALKFLRDQLLPRHVAWAGLPHEAQIQINRAIDAGALGTTKVENPRMPQYPVTAVALNRQHAIVIEVLRSFGAPPPTATPASRNDDSDEPS